MKRPREKRFLTNSQRREIGERIAAEIVNKGKNKAWLAEKLDCSPAHVSQFCRDGSISLDRLAHICILLSTSADYMLWGIAHRGGPDGRVLAQLAHVLEQIKIHPQPKQ